MSESERPHFRRSVRSLAMIVWSDSAGMMDLKPVNAALMELLDAEVPEVRSRRPLWDLKHPEAPDWMQA